MRAAARDGGWQVSALDFVRLQQEMARVIVVIKHLLDRLLVALLTNGHVLLEGVPRPWQRRSPPQDLGPIASPWNSSGLQFTPDMLPGRHRGDDDLQPSGWSRSGPKHGPIFSNLILADEINRAPAKVQSALLESDAGTPGNDWR